MNKCELSHKILFHYNYLQWNSLLFAVSFFSKPVITSWTNPSRTVNIEIHSDCRRKEVDIRWRLKDMHRIHLSSLSMDPWNRFGGLL